ncbi:hypothetical protein [Anaerosporobacter sp.]|uniref:hypothetical protein n=1 Tax=Anaerosporobacter sp. TaxID=1872529 RepID=UPI00286F7AAA|nr:hypothetical protein [Anaerosporobacter sp.]
MSEGIAYQNKDIEFKLLSQGFKEKSFHIYGLDIPKIKELLPTNLPKVSADEKRIDNLFLLEDDTIAIVDYESDDKESNRIKYMNYIVRVLERYYKEGAGIVNIRMIVIYTGDVEEAEDTLEIPSLTLRMEQVFLSKLDGEPIYQAIKQKIESKEQLNEEELMQLIILPLTDKGKEKKQERVKQVVELAKQIEEDEQQVFVIAGILVNSDKFIDKSYAEQVRRWLSMSKVFQIFEEEKQEAVNEARLAAQQEFAVKMIELDMDIVQIMKVTGLTRKQIEELRDSSSITK